MPETPKGFDVTQPSNLRNAPRPRSNRALGQQLIVLLPTLAVSALLGHWGLALGPRILASLGFGAVLIAGVAYFRR